MPDLRLKNLTHFISILLLFIVAACNNPKGESVLSANHTPFLDSPGDFSFTQVRSGAGTASLNWSNSARVAQYTVFYGTASNDITTPVSACTGITNSCSVTGLNPATLYYFTVKSTNSAGTKDISADTNALSVGTFDITASSSGMQVMNLSWSASSAATSYNIIYGTSSGSYPNVITNVTSPYTITGLSNSLTVYARVVALNSQNGYIESTSEAVETTSGPSVAPTGLAAISSPGSVALSWNLSGGGPTYNIYRGTSSGSLALLTSGVAGTNYTDASVSNGITYYYAITSFNGFESAQSAEVLTRPISSFALTSATTYSATSIELNWGAATGAASYDVEYGITSATYTTTLTNQTSPLVVNSLIPGTTYYFTIRARNSVGSGTSLLSNERNAVTSSATPTVTISSSPTIINANSNAYTVSGTCSENSRVVTVNIGSLTVNPICNSLSWTTTNNVTSVGDSLNLSITANHTTSLGVSATQASATVLKDTVDPTVLITSSPAINNTNRNAYTVSGTCSENTRAISVSVGGVTASPACTALTWSATLNVSSVADFSAVPITANHSDSAGNTAAQASTTVVKDTGIPTVTIASAPVINLSNFSSYTVSGACSDNSRIVSVNVGGVTASPACSALAWSATVDLTAIADNTSFSITADHTDAALNIASQASTLIIKDTIVPTVNVTFNPAIGLGNESSYTVTGDCSENSRTVTVNVGGLTSAPTCTALAWSATLDVSTLPDGSITITANHNDLAGNIATQSSVSVNKDTSLATVTIDSYPDINQSNQTGYTISGTCSVNGTNVNLMIGSISRTANCSSGTWNTGIVNVSSLSDGSVLITADHSNALQATRTVSKDTTTETVTITSAPNITFANRTSYVASGTCSQNGQSVTVNIDGLVFNRTCSSGTWSTGSVNVSSLSDGTGLIVTANHPSALQASTTINKATSTPTVFGLSVATTLTNSADLVWNLSDPGGFTINDYVINYRIKGSPTWFTFTDGVNTNKYTTVTGLNQSTVYEFRVALIYNTSFQSAWTNTAEGETKPVNIIFSPYSAMNVGGSTVTRVVAIKDGTNITLNGSPLTTLNKGQTFNFSSVKFDVIDANKPIYTAGRRGGTSAGTSGNITWIPTAWAGRSFNFNATRNNPQILEVYAIENTFIEVKQGPTVLDSATVTAGSGATLTWSVFGSYQITSSGNVLAYHMSLNGANLYDPKPIMPSFTEILGFPSNSMRLTSDLDGTNYSAIHSNSSTTSGSLNKVNTIQINPQGGTTTLYQSESLLINADKNIGGASFADSNGLCAAPFMPTNLMKTTYAIPTNSDYAAFASLLPGTIQVRDVADNLVTTLTFTRSGANLNAPYRVRIANPLSGYRFISTVPMAAWYQPNNYTNAADEDETILYGTNE